MPILNWDYRCHEIPRKGVVRDLQLDSETRGALAQELNVLGFERVSVSYALVPLRAARFGLKGRVEADVTVECGVSLDPVVQRIDETFDVEFWPATEDQPDDLGFDPLADIDVETIRNGKIDVGRLISEIVASAIDPFARDENVQLARDVAEPKPDPKSHPFAALAVFKSENDGAND